MTHQSPSQASLQHARARIRENFLALITSVTGTVKLPPDHTFQPSPALSAEHELTWNGGCEVRSASGGLSLHAGPTPADCDRIGADQVRIELRYFHPGIDVASDEQAAGALGPQLIQFRPGQTAHEATLWIEQGPNVVGSSAPLQPPANLSAATVDELAALAADQMSAVLAEFRQEQQEPSRDARPRAC